MPEQMKAKDDNESNLQATQYRVLNGSNKSRICLNILKDNIKGKYI